MYQLRPYQQQAVDTGLDSLNNSKSGILVLPTGAGKSLVIASIAKELEGHTLIFQPTKEILEQNLQKTIDFGFSDIGVYSASAGRKDFGKITFATIGSVKNKKDEFAHFENIIIDECHTVNAKGGMYDDFIKENGGKVLGLTATPYRLQAYVDMKTGRKSVVAKFLHRTRPSIFKEVSHITQISDMYQNGFLCPVDYYENKNYDHSQIKLNSTGMDFDEQALKDYNRKAGVIQMAQKAITHDYKHILVFCVFVAEAEELSRELQTRGINAVSISAQNTKSEREQILSDFRSGKIQVVTNVGVLTTGFDFPELDCVILARPTQSVALYYQMIGRGIRNAPNKTKVKVIDVCGNVKRFGKIDQFHIEGENHKMRLKSNVSFLTGYDFVHNEDLEAKNYEGKKESAFSVDIVQFGKHKGTHVSKLPNDYLTWCVKTFDKGKAKEMFEKELARRCA